MRQRIVREPVYCQLVALLRDRIRAGRHLPGSRFLTERDVAERFKVSRPTANKALSALVAEGALDFRKGVGTFVRAGSLDYDLSALVSFTDKAGAAGMKPSTRVIRFERIPAGSTDEPVRSALLTDDSEGLVRMVRLRMADGMPVILERRHLVGRHCPGLRKKDVSGSLYRALTVRFGLEITGAREVIRAVSIRGGDAGLLRVRPGTAGLCVTAVAHTVGDVPLWHEVTLYRGDAYEFRNRLGPVRSARPATGVLRDAVRP
jgi:GntR family transcriptional regulator